MKVSLINLSFYLQNAQWYLDKFVIDTTHV